MILNFGRVIQEYMDYSDRDTVRAVIEATDKNQNQMLIALTSKLYEMIVAKVANIDYGTISRSRGDITKIENYSDLLETINVIRRIVAEYKCDTKPVDTVNTAISNVASRTNQFKRAFTINSPIAVMLYNNVCTAIVSSISFLIDTCIEYIKNPQSQTFQMALDVVAYNKTMQNLMFESLETFNYGCSSGDIDEALKTALRQSKIKREAAEFRLNIKEEVEPSSPFLSDEQIKGGGREVIHDDDDGEEDVMTRQVDEAFDGIVSLVGRGLLAICKLTIPIIRQIAYLYFHSRQSISDYFESNAELLEMNAYEIQYRSDLDPDRRQEIYDKQMKIAAKWRQRAQRTSIDYKRAKKAAEEDIKEEKKKFTASDINYNGNDETGTDDVSVSSVLF